jgi:hypothetical protein
LAPSRKVKKATYGLPQLQIMQPGPIWAIYQKAPLAQLEVPEAAADPH